MKNEDFILYLNKEQAKKFIDSTDENGYLAILEILRDMNARQYENRVQGFEKQITSLKGKSSILQDEDKKAVIAQTISKASANILEKHRAFQLSLEKTKDDLDILRDLILRRRDSEFRLDEAKAAAIQNEHELEVGNIDAIRQSAQRAQKIIEEAEQAVQLIRRSTA